MKILLLLCTVTLTRGSSLWTMNGVRNSDMNFLVNQNENSVAVNAFIKDPLLLAMRPEKSIKFYLFTRNQLQGIQLQINDNATLWNSGFDLKTETKLLVHGFGNSITSDFNRILKDVYAEKDNNVIIVDWSALCTPPFYTWAVENVQQVGTRTSQLLAWLVSRGLTLSRLHILGHSIGAHIAGIAADHLKHLGIVARITGLDPAKPMFELESEEYLLDSKDAEFVDCIHTCGGFLGLSQPICSADFYPNGGTSPQPGCTFDFFGKCSHQRAYLYYAESVSWPNSFKAVSCGGVESYSPINCSDGTTFTMGEHADIRSRGVFYLATASTPPYSVTNPTVPTSTLNQFLWYFMKIKN